MSCSAPSTNPSSTPPVTVRFVPATTVLTVSGSVPEREFGAFLDEAYLALPGAQMNLGIEITGPPGALYPNIDDDGPQRVTAFLPLT